jgi:glycosyltransferase involved in cell wall biosynthesis
MKSNSIKSVDYSIVIPVYQNEGSLNETFRTLKENVIDKNPQYTGEIIFVDDGSSDGSFQCLVDLQKNHPELIVIIKLTRNFGTYPAIIAGYEKATGKCVINVSADLQDPPELIHEMLHSHFEDKYNIVICTREAREEGLYRKFTSKIFYGVVKKLCFPDMPAGGFDFSLISKKVKDEILCDLEADFFLQGKILWAGYEIKYISYTRRKREAGKSQWTFSKKLKWFIDSVMSYSFFPIRFISAFGIILSFTGFLYAIYVFFYRLFSDNYIYGWAPIVILILILSGFQMLMLGVIGEYVWRTLSQVRRRPKYIVEEIIELD